MDFRLLAIFVSLLLLACFILIAYKLMIEED